MTTLFSTKKRIIILGWAVCILSALFYCYEYLLRIEPSVMVPELMQSFGVTAGGLSLLVAMYYYAYTPLQAIVGVVTDRFGPRRVLIMAICFCALGAYVFGATNNVYVASAGRFMVGVGSAFAFVGVLKLAAIWLPESQFAMFTGLTTSLGMVGAMFGDVELTRIVHRLGWHHVMTLSVFVGVVLVIMFFFVVRERDDEHVTEAHRYECWHKLLGDFWDLVKKPQLWLAGLVGCILYLSLTVVGEMWGIPFLHRMFPGTHEVAAKLNAMIFFGWLVGSPLMGWVSDRVRSRRRPMILGSMMAALTITVLIGFMPHDFYKVAGLLFLFGVFSSAEILAFVIARESVGTELVATAIGFINLLVMLGGMVVQPLVGFMIDLGWQGETEHGIHVYSLATYRYALIIVPVLMLIGAMLAFMMRESYHEKEF